MKELDKARAIALEGTDADKAEAAFRRQMEQWKVPLPPAKVLVLDFGLGNFDGMGLIECWIANEMEAGYCGKYLFLFDGQVCPAHLHEEKHETFYVAKGSISIHVDGVESRMTEGDVLALPPGKMHSFTGIGPALLLELSTPCMVDDNYFANPEIPIGKNTKPKQPAPHWEIKNG